MKRGFSIGLVACLVAVVLIAIFGRSSQEAEGLGTVSILLTIVGVVGYAAFKSAKADDMERKVEELQKSRNKLIEAALEATAQDNQSLDGNCKINSSPSYNTDFQPSRKKNNTKYR